MHRTHAHKLVDMGGLDLVHAACVFHVPRDTLTIALRAQLDTWILNMIHLCSSLLNRHPCFGTNKQRQPTIPRFITLVQLANTNVLVIVIVVVEQLEYSRTLVASIPKQSRHAEVTPSHHYHHHYQSPSPSSSSQSASSISSSFFAASNRNCVNPAMSSKYAPSMDLHTFCTNSILLALYASTTLEEHAVQQRKAGTLGVIMV
mmetsp:Transcript_753/g.2134  ORF Transcript_753/g.2134 Transcript_753/m.2134 type:complete len:203 (+) Transcript_753:389-997(+)